MTITAKIYKEMNTKESCNWTIFVINYSICNTKKERFFDSGYCNNQHWPQRQRGHLQTLFVICFVTARGFALSVSLRSLYCFFVI